MDTLETNPELGEAVLEVVRNQIQDNEPPETRQTFERLKGNGCTADEARRLIATAVAVELFHTIRDREPYNRERFVWNLARLPQELCDDEGNGLYPG